MADIQKDYIYQIFQDGVFLGVLQNVTSEFNYAQDINSNAVQLQVEVNITADVADNPLQPLQDEAGNNLLDEAGATLYEERSVDVVGGFNPKALIQEDNNLKVYEVSSLHTNGVLVFDGYIEDWTAIMGSDTDKITFLAISKGVDLQDYLVAASATLDQSQAVNGGFFVPVYNVGSSTIAPKLQFSYVGQSWVVGASATPLSGIAIMMETIDSGSCDVTVSVYDNSAFSGTALATVTRTIRDPTNTDTEYVFTFPSTVAVTPGNTYYFKVTSTQYILVIYNSATNLYANGTMYSNNADNPFWAAVPANGILAGSDLYFKTYYSGAVTSVPFSATDPATILSSIITTYNGYGGAVTTAAGTVDATSTTATYTFKVNTVLEGVKKCLDLSPYNWYWYVDPGTTILYFKQTPTTATHKFIKGRHFNQIEIGGTVENVRNVVYFSGGDDGSGANIFRKYTSTTSLAARRRRLERLSDNRVTRTDTADLISNNFISSHAATAYSSPITILDISYDIDLINVGDTVQLEGFGNFADTLLLQVARLVRYPDKIDLTLGVVLQRQSDALLKAVNDLNLLQTVANPSTPS
jgi:hypothetical protein